jgi:hypothetical protein
MPQQDLFFRQNPMALFSMIVPFPKCAVALRIRTDFDCFKAGVSCAFVAIDKLNTNSNMYIFYSFFLFRILNFSKSICCNGPYLLLHCITVVFFFLRFFGS